MQKPKFIDNSLLSSLLILHTLFLLEKRKKLNESEKNLTREIDAVTLQRRELPWVLVEKEYSFSTLNGPMSLSELFLDKNDLIIYHMM